MFVCTNATRQAVGHVSLMLSHSHSPFWREVHDDPFMSVVSSGGANAAENGREIVQCNMAALQTRVGARAAHAA